MPLLESLKIQNIDPLAILQKSFIKRLPNGVYNVLIRLSNNLKLITAMIVADHGFI